jgi:hypothetical protein
MRRRFFGASRTLVLWASLLALLSLVHARPALAQPTPGTPSVTILPVGPVPPEQFASVVDYTVTWTYDFDAHPDVVFAVEISCDSGYVSPFTRLATS